MKNGHIIKRTKQHVTATTNAVKDNLRDEMMKPNKQQMDNKHGEIIKRLTKSYNNEGETT